MQAAKICSIPAFGRPQLPCHCTRDSETHTHPSHLSCSPLTSPISCLCLLPLALSSPISRVHSNARVGVRAHCCRCSPGSSGGADAEQEGSCRTEKVLQWAGKGDNKQNMLCFIFVPSFLPCRRSWKRLGAWLKKAAIFSRALFRLQIFTIWIL